MQPIHADGNMVRRRYWLIIPTILLIAGLWPASLSGQTLAPGMTIPVRLQTTLNSEKDLQGKTFAMATVQEIPFRDHQVIPRGAEITGHIVVAESFKKGEHDSRLVLQFDTIEMDRHHTAIAREDVRRAIEALPGELRAVVWLSDGEELPLREIAEILGRPVGTVASRLWRGRSSLRKLLSAYGPPRERQV